MLFAIPIPLYSKHIYKMKTNLLLLAVFLMFVSCDKEDVNTIPADIYGSYHGTQSCQPTYNGNPIVTVSENDNESIKLSKLALVAHPIIVKCDGSELRIEPQTFTMQVGRAVRLPLQAQGITQPTSLALTLTYIFQ